MVAFAIVSLYIAIASLSVSDEILLRDADLSLPGLGVGVRASFFFMVAPWLLVLVHFNAIVQAVILARRISAFRRAASEGHNLSPEQRSTPDALTSSIPMTHLATDTTIPRGYRALLTCFEWAILIFAPIAMLVLLHVKFLPFQHSGDPLQWLCVALVLALTTWLCPDIYSVVKPVGTLTWPSMLSSIYYIIGLDLRLRWLAKLLTVVLILSAMTLSFSDIFVEWKFLWAPLKIENRLKVPNTRLYSSLEPSLARACNTTDEEGNSLGLVLTRRSLNGVQLSGSSLCNAKLEDATMQDADLRDASLHGAVFRRADLQSADLENAMAHNADFDRTEAHKANFKGAELNGAAFRDAHLTMADFGDAILSGASLLAAELRCSKLQNAQLQGANLWRADLRGTDLRHADLQGANLLGAQLQGADLGYAKLRGANLEGADLQGANLGGTQLQGAILDGADLRGVVSSGTEGFAKMGFGEWILERAGSESDLEGVAFDGGVDQDDIRAAVDAMNGYVSHEDISRFSDRVKGHVGRRGKRDAIMESGAIIGTYSKTDAGNWIWVDEREACNSRAT